MSPKKYQVKKPMSLAGISFIVLTFLIAIVKKILPEGIGGWSEPPIFDYLYFIGIGICVIVLSMGFAYHSWILDEKEYKKWFAKQQFSPDKNILSWSRIYPRGTVIWVTRLITPIGVLFGSALIVYALISIFKFVFGLFA